MNWLLIQIICIFLFLSFFNINSQFCLYIYIDLHEKFFSKHVEKKIINGSFLFFCAYNHLSCFLLMKINDPKQKKLNNLDDTEKKRKCLSINHPLFFVNIMTLYLVFNRHLVYLKDLFGCILIIQLFTFNGAKKNKH
jgi:hypothetical protein